MGESTKFYLDIYKQLIYRIRYLDIRLKTNSEKEILLSHDRFEFTNKKLEINTFKCDIFDKVIDFLHYNPSETVYTFKK